MNDLIVKKIKEARLERGKTQSQLAERLGRSPAAISELERGKVQVSASDLNTIAEYLNKPIEYFYGEDFGDKEIQDLIAIIRKQPPEARNQSIAITSLLLFMQSIGDKLNKDPDFEPSIDEIRQFLDAFIVFSNQINQMTGEINDLRAKFVKELKSQGIDITG